MLQLQSYDFVVWVDVTYFSTILTIWGEPFKEFTEKCSKTTVKDLREAQWTKRVNGTNAPCICKSFVPASSSSSTTKCFGYERDQLWYSVRHNFLTRTQYSCDMHWFVQPRWTTATRLPYVQWALTWIYVGSIDKPSPWPTNPLIDVCSHVLACVSCSYISG